MKGSSPLRKEWILTREAFDRLLAVLDPDRARAAEKYEQIRQKLTYLFECRGCPSGLDLADEAFNRFARRIPALDGEEIRNATSYLCGIAQNMIKEHGRDLRKHTVSLEELPRSREPAQPPDAEYSASDSARREQMHDCLLKCLERRASHERMLISEYYQGEQRTKRDSRRRLAERLRITMNALSLRAHRIRLELEACVNECLNPM